MRLWIVTLVMVLVLCTGASALTISLDSASVQNNANLNQSAKDAAILNVTVDSASTIKLSINNGSYTTLASNATAASKSNLGLSEGSNGIRIVAIQSNVSNATLFLSVKVDTTKPTAAVTFSPSATAPGAQNVILTWEFNDANLGDSWIAVTDPNGTVITNQSDHDDNYALLASTLVSGTYTATYQAWDMVGNKVTGSKTLSVSNDPPEVTLIGPANGTVTKNRYIKVECRATDENLTRLTVYHDNDQSFQAEQNKLANSSQTVWFNLTNLDSEEFVWNCRAEDAGGEIAFAEENRTIIVDSTPPSISALSPTDGFGTLKKDVTFQWVVTDNFADRIDCDLFIDDKKRKDFNVNSGDEAKGTFEVGDGKHSYYVSCFDEVGNNRTTEKRSMTIDLGLDEEKKEEPKPEEKKEEPKPTPEPEPVKEESEDKVVVKAEPVLIDPQDQEDKSMLRSIAEALGGRFTFKKSMYIVGFVVAIMLLGLLIMGVRAYSKDNIMFRVKVRKYKFMAKKFWHRVVRRNKKYY